MDKLKKRCYPTRFMIPALVLFGVFYVLPLLGSFVLSFTDWHISRIFEPKFVGFKNFSYIFTDEYFYLALKNTFTFAVITTLAIIIIGLGLALILNVAFKGHKFFRTLFYMPAVLSLIVVGIMFTSLLEMNGGVINNILIELGLENLTNDWLGNVDTAFNMVILMQIWKWSGFSMAIFLAGLQSIPTDYLEAARIDGAGAWHRFRHIIFPLLAPAFTIVVTTNTIGGFKVFEQVYVLTGGGPGNATQVLGTYIYQAFSTGILGRSTAMGLFQFLVIATIALTLNTVLKKREVDL